jgi:hypothetical protein
MCSSAESGLNEAEGASPGIQAGKRRKFVGLGSSSKISGAGAGAYNIPVQNRLAGKTLNPAFNSSSKTSYSRYFVIAAISLRGDIDNAYQSELSPHISE